MARNTKRATVTTTVIEDVAQQDAHIASHALNAMHDDDDTQRDDDVASQDDAQRDAHVITHHVAQLDNDDDDATQDDATQYGIINVKLTKSQRARLRKLCGGKLIEGRWSTNPINIVVLNKAGVSYRLV